MRVGQEGGNLLRTWFSTPLAVAPVRSLLTRAPVHCDHSFGPYFSEPVICGLEGASNKPYLCGMDLLGAQVYTDDFILAGDCPEAMYGLCESIYKPDLEPDQLFEVLAQCLLSGVDRDCLAGWGCTVHVLTPEGLTTRNLKGRMD